MRVARNDFARLLQTVIKAVETRTSIPILGTVLLAAKGGTLSATITDLDVEVSGTIASDGDINTCLDARLLAGIASKAAGDEIEITVNGSDASIVAGRGRYKLRALPAGDFPSMPVNGMPEPFTIDFSALVDPVKFAISSDDARFYLCGAYIEAVDGEVVAVATDGHRLARNAVAIECEFKSIIVPTKAVSLIPKGEISLSVSDSKIIAEKDGVRVVSKLIDGTYPDYRRVIPTGNDKHVTFDKKTLADAIDRVAVVGEGARGIKLSITPGAIDLSVRGESEADDTVAIDYSGEPVDIVFNSRYALDVLASLPDGDIELALTDGGTATLFTTAAEEARQVVLMPMRI